MALFKRKKEQKKDNQQTKKVAPVKDGKKTDKPQKSSKERTKGSQISYKALLHPLITEKSTIQNSLNQYAFVAAKRANKIDIKRAVKEIYGVTPLKVRIINNLGKTVRTGRRGITTRRKNWKKAIVILPQGKKIDVYEGV